MKIRAATLEDDRALAALDHDSWEPVSSPTPRPTGDRFLRENEGPAGVLVAEDEDGSLVGWVRVVPKTELDSNAHVRHVNGLGIDPGARRRGIARELMAAAERSATEAGATRITLRVFGHNTPARELYESLGYEVEGILPGEFILDGRDIDDVLMGKRLEGS